MVPLAACCAMALVVAVPGPLVGQTLDSVAPPAATSDTGAGRDGDAMRLVYRYQALQRQLEGVRRQAFQDPDVAEAARRAERVLRERMRAIDEHTDTYLERLETMGRAYRQAASAGDSIRMEAARQLGGRLAVKLGQLRSEAMEHSEAEEALGVLDRKLEAEMQRIAPALDELRRRLRAVQDTLVERYGAETVAGDSLPPKASPRRSAARPGGGR